MISNFSLCRECFVTVGEGYSNMKRAISNCTRRDTEQGILLPVLLKNKNELFTLPNYAPLVPYRCFFSPRNLVVFNGFRK